MIHINLSTLVGFIVGFSTFAIFFYINYRIGKKQRRFDERYQQVQKHARSLAWGISTILLVSAWTITYFVEGLGFSFFLLTFVYVSHLIAYVISAYIADKKF